MLKSVTVTSEKPISYKLKAVCIQRHGLWKDTLVGVNPMDTW